MESSTSSRKEYMREYQRKRYHADQEKAKSCRNSLRCRLKDDVSNELWDKYKHHLADVIKLQDIIRKLPVELVSEILTKEQIMN